MAFSSQSFRAPKINKGNFSSPLSSSASKISGSISAPKLNTTKISFIKKENSPIVEAVNNNAESLTQTNEILIEIQKQLAFDFANRIAEEKDAIKKIKAEESRRRFREEEKAVEGTNKIKKGLFGAFDKVMAPAKGIFDKLLEFFSIVLTGFIANKAFDWLKNPENREKITGILNWIGENWKLLTGLFVISKLLEPLGAFFTFAKLISRLFRRGGGLGPDKLRNIKNSKPPKPGGMDCKPVLDCIKKNPVKVLQYLGLGALTTLGIVSSGSGVNAGVDGPVPVPSPVPVPTGRGEGRRAFDPNRTIEPINVPATAAGIAGAFATGGLIAMILAPEPISTKLGIAGLLSRFPKLAQVFGKVKVPQTARLRADQAFMKSGSDAMRGGANTPGLGSSGKKGPELLDSLVGSPPGNAAAQQAATAKGMTINPSRVLGAVDKFRKPTTKMPPNPTPKVNIRPEAQFRSLLPFAGLFTLPMIRSPQTPKPAPVATQTVSIDAVDRNNMYRRTTPNIYGMGVFAF